MRQGRDLAVNEALLSVRRLLRQEPRAVAAAFEQAAGQDGCLGAMQVVELLQQQHLMPGALKLIRCFASPGRFSCILSVFVYLYVCELCCCSNCQRAKPGYC